MNHILFRDPALQGWEYGMQRSFENAIRQITAATVIDLPSYSLGKKYLHHFGHGMNKAVFRKYFPKQDFRVSGDVAWYILMAPENYRLDLFTKWSAGCSKKVLYLYDTLPAQYPLIRKHFSDGTWDLLITSFEDAVGDLERETGRKWHSIEQAADEKLFVPIPYNQRSIHFSSYGRRFPKVHEVLKDFCRTNNLYYDFTTHDGKHPVAEPAELYRQYAWHMTQSIFTFSWPVELTNPARAGHLRPITCRWFEAAAAGTILIGKAPANNKFDLFFDKDLVHPIDPDSAPEEIKKTLQHLWERREVLFQKANIFAQQHRTRLVWKERVERIMALIEK